MTYTSIGPVPVILPIEGVGAGNIPVAVKGLEDTNEFADVILHNRRTAMDLALIEQELLEAGRDLIRQTSEIRSIVLECTDPPPYAASLQKELRLPVFDITTLACMAHDVVARVPYHGLMPW
ncbi:MAG: hypothetical protein GY789_08500 [Hyphomicrobiales bacterium]|nr:hypothetical protein [Hyphomicrobiales bacterium]MCP4997723.1 hypothetical protein [Hyphomicrobiales bacterium]